MNAAARFAVIVERLSVSADPYVLGLLSVCQSTRAFIATMSLAAFPSGGLLWRSEMREVAVGRVRPIEAAVNSRLSCCLDNVGHFCSALTASVADSPRRITMYQMSLSQSPS